MSWTGHAHQAEGGRRARSPRRDGEQSESDGLLWPRRGVGRPGTAGIDPWDTEGVGATAGVEGRGAKAVDAGCRHEAAFDREGRGGGGGATACRRGWRRSVGGRDRRGGEGLGGSRDVSRAERASGSGAWRGSNGERSSSSQAKSWITPYRTTGKNGTASGRGP